MFNNPFMLGCITILNDILKLETLNRLFPCLVWLALGVCAVLWFLLIYNVIHSSCDLSRLRRRTDDDQKIFREMIRHENDLINHRLTWLMASEGLLFTALGVVVSKGNTAIANQLIPILSFMGVLLAVSANFALHGADMALWNLSGLAPADKRKPDVIGYRNCLYGLFSPWRIFPPMFIVAWSLIKQIHI